MILRTEHTLTPAAVASQIELPLKFEAVDGATVVIVKQVEDELVAIQEFHFDGSLLQRQEHSGHFEIGPNEERIPLPRLGLPPGVGPQARSVDDLVDALSFLLDRAVNVRRKGRGGEFVSESDADTALLATVDSPEPYSATGAQAWTRTFSPEVTDENVKAVLAGREVGVRLFADAHRLSLPTSRFRELWKVLESAFGTSAKQLVNQLASFEPARTMRFDNAELAELRSLRDRASHAQIAVQEGHLDKIERECREKAPRLACLVERVIVTKMTWGSSDLAVEERARLDAFTDKDNRVVYIQRKRA